jgi:hypothetical protein
MNTRIRSGHLLLCVCLAIGAGSLNLRAASPSPDDPAKKDGDLFVASASLVDGFGNTAGGVWRVRGTTATLFCSSPASSFDPGFWNVPISLIVDAKGRVVFLAGIGGQNIGLLRCDQPGVPAEMIAAFHLRAAIPAGWAEPFPGVTFNDRLGSLHIVRERAIYEDVGHAPQVVNEDAYEFVAQRIFTQADGSPAAAPYEFIRYGTETATWQSGLDLPDVLNTSNNLPSVVAHGDSLWMLNGGAIRRTSMGIKLSAAGKIGGLDYRLTYGLFGGVHELASSISDDTTIPNVSSGCNTDPPGKHDDVTDLMPLVGSGFVPMNASTVAYDEHGDLGVVFTTNYGPMPGPYLTHVASALLNDDPNDDQEGYFHQAFDSCRHVPWVQFSPILPWNTPDVPALSNVTDAIATAPGGMVGVSFWGNSLVRLTPGDRVTPIATLYHPQAVAAYPAIVPSAGTVVYITIHSPVDVLVTDAAGRRIGVDPVSGLAVNDFGQHGFDSGAGEPRVIAIENPAPGPYAVQAVGTGAGAYTIDVSSADLATGTSARVSATGTAAPGLHFDHDFTLAADATVTFASTPPPPDTTAPTVSCAAPDAGWHAANVALPCTSADSGSGLANAADAAFTLATEVAAGAETATAATSQRLICDRAGNCATAGPLGGNHVDLRPPAIHIVLPASGAFLLGAATSSVVSCDDGGSGVATCAADAPGLDTSSIGTRPLVVHATDAVGNAATATAQYSVRYGLAFDIDRDQDQFRVQLLDGVGGNRSSREVAVVALGFRPAGSNEVLPLGRAVERHGRFRLTHRWYELELQTRSLPAGTYELLLSVGGQDGYAIPFTIPMPRVKR